MNSSLPLSPEAWVPPHETEVSFSFLRHVGPRFVHGAVRLSFERASEFTFISQAKWPAEENYDSAVSAAVEQVLASAGSQSLKTKVVLKSIEWDPVNSSESGFRRAAEAATSAALSV
ncbi:conserved hypothetical protein [uncultured Defluviicoccus sp.]|uniref:Uncharacterized protein n=1 Tax=metagenome TaxID=256318 RepID=A0A380TC73_9ZZZZ|nr:conserved hypothetical protein [uncultured Defluviicoccus sp.]